MTADDLTRSVVGLDGSAASMPAMRWALAHADLFGPPQPVMVWHYPAAMWSTTFAGPATADAGELALAT